ncbi:MAG: CvpA family protein [Chloroflexi bacterium]|nr:CvpA family protein [Chloroflexota bacterium]
MEISIPYIYVLVLLLAAFGVMGLARGWARDAAALAGVFVSWMVVAKLGGTILEFVNRVARAILFLTQGGIETDDPAQMAVRLSKVQLADLAHPDVPLALLFGLFILIVYLLSSRLIDRRTTWPGKAGGALLGALNGYLVSYAMLQAPSPRTNILTTLTFPVKDIALFLGQYLAAALIIAVGIVIVFALFNGIRTARRSADAGWAQKRKG